MNKYYHRGNGEVVKVIGDYIQPSLKYFDNTILELPVYAHCSPDLPVGWFEGEEVKQLQNADKTYWGECSDFIFDIANDNVRRIWIEPVAERGIVINGGEGFVKDQLRPCDCIDLQDVKKLEEQGVGHNDESISVIPNYVLLKMGHTEIKIGMNRFKMFAEWYLAPQKIKP